MTTSDDDSRETHTAGLPPWSRWLLPLIPCLAAIVAFGQVVGFAFVWDDGNLIAKNPWLHRTDTLWRAFFSDFWELTNSPKMTGMYRPLVTVSYWIEHQIWQEESSGYHLTNLLLHMGATALVYVLLRRLSMHPTGAAVGASFFAIHPVQVEAVANIASRTDLLATLWLLVAVLLWMSRGRRWLALPCLLASLLCKESVVLGPLLLIMMGAWAHRGKQPWFLRYSPLAVLPLYAALRQAALPGVPFAEWTTAFADWKGSYVVVLYMSRVLLPLPRAPIEDVPHPGWWVVVLCTIVVVLAAALGGLRVKDERTRLALGWFALSLAPVAEFVPFGARFSDLLLYLPMVGPAMLVGRWLPPRRVWLAAASVVLLGCCTLSAFRASHWKNNLALWTYGTAHDPTSPTMQMNLANALRAAGQVEEGCRRLVVTLELLERRPVPDTAAKTHYNLGNCYLKARRYDASIRHYREATVISGGEIHQTRHNLVVALIEGGHLQQAVVEARYFTQANPNEAAAWRVLGIALARSGRMARAVEAFEASLRLDPHHEQTRRMLDAALNQAGRPR